ncbi:MAG TPA: AMP-binding protein [Pseudobacteroides sp.]|nr:AMP-binding protein [Pseudobacteroides sp.]
MKKGIEIYNENGRRIVRGTGYYEPEVKVKDIKEIVNCARKYGDKTGFKFKDKSGKIVEKTYNEFVYDIDCLGTGLMSIGLKNASIAILSENRYDWGVCYLSVVNGVGIVVPMDKYLPAKEVENLIERGKVEAIFYSSSYQKVMDDVAKSNNRIKYFICMDDIKGKDIENTRFISMSEVKMKGKSLLDGGDKSFTDVVINRNKMSILLFTSGTTSMAKGVMLSHANIADNVVSISTVIKLYKDDVHLSLLPLHHTFENTVGFLFMVYSGTCIAYCDGIKHIAQNLKEYNVSVLIAVPAIFEALYRKTMEGVKKAGKEKSFNKALKISGILRKFGIDIRRKLFKGIFNQLGPCLRLAVSGAAPLDKEVITGFENIGFKVLQGYGLTETSPVVATNNDFINVPGSIGYPISGVEVTLDTVDDNGMGEIMVRGENVMLGYFDNPEETKEVITSDGWFKTGDLGTIDNEGIIRITGRAKSMIVLSNGKKAFPEEYEVLLNNIKGVKDSFVWGNIAPDGDVQVCAELVIDKDNIMDDNGRMLSEQELASMFDKEIKEINKELPQYKIIRYFIMTYDDIAKTTTLKIKRPVEYEKVKSKLEKSGLEIRKASGKIY